MATKNTERPIADWVLVSYPGERVQYDALKKAFFERQRTITLEGITAQTGSDIPIRIKIRPNGWEKQRHTWRQKPLQDIGDFRSATLRTDGIIYDLVCTGGKAAVLVGRKDDFKGARPKIGSTRGHGSGDVGNGDRY